MSGKIDFMDLLKFSLSVPKTGVEWKEIIILALASVASAVAGLVAAVVFVAPAIAEGLSFSIENAGAWALVGFAALVAAYAAYAAVMTAPEALVIGRIMRENAFTKENFAWNKLGGYALLGVKQSLYITLSIKNPVFLVVLVAGMAALFLIPSLIGLVVGGILIATYLTGVTTYNFAIVGLAVPEYLNGGKTRSQAIEDANNTTKGRRMDFLLAYFAVFVAAYVVTNVIQLPLYPLLVFPPTLILFLLLSILAGFFLGGYVMAALAKGTAYIYLKFKGVKKIR